GIPQGLILLIGQLLDVVHLGCIHAVGFAGRAVGIREGEAGGEIMGVVGVDLGIPLGIVMGGVQPGIVDDCRGGHGIQCLGGAGVHLIRRAAALLLTGGPCAGVILFFHSQRVAGLVLAVQAVDIGAIVFIQGFDGQVTARVLRVGIVRPL